MLFFISKVNLGDLGNVKSITTQTHTQSWLESWYVEAVNIFLYCGKQSVDIQQVRLTAAAASWLAVPRPVISTENSTTRLAEPRGERDRSEPRFFTFSDLHPCTWDSHGPAQNTATRGRASASRGGGGAGAGAGGEPRVMVLNPDLPRERLVTLTSGEGARLTFADVYTREYLYTLPVLFLAAARGNSAITYLLLKYGAAAGAVDTLGNTPLHLAACQLHVAWESVLDLLEFGAPVTRTNAQGTAPLHLQPALVRLVRPSPHITSVIVVF